MASPFSVFRKHRKAMLAGLTILTMFGFVFLPIMLETMGARGGANPPVVKTRTYGSISEKDLEGMRRQREKVLNVLVSALVDALHVDPNQASSYLSGIIGDGSEESVVEGWLQARRAEQLGVVVTNEAIKSYLRQLTRDSLEAKRLREIFSRQGFSEHHFFLALHDELLAMRLREMFQTSLIGAPPAQRWDYYTRLKRQATVEVIPVPVERFLGKVAEPDEATLKKFFEEHKDKIQLPNSPDPGFREPQKVNIRYFKAELEKFVAEVTDDEVKQEYEKNKELYDKQEAVEGKPPAAERPSAEKAPAEKPTTETPAPEKPAASEPAAEKPAAEKPAAEKPAGEKPSSEKPDSETPATKSPDPHDQSSARAGSPFRLAAFLLDRAEEQKADEGKVPAAGSKQPAGESQEPATEPNAPAKEPQPPPAGPALPAAEQKPGEKPAAAATPPAAAPPGKAGETGQQPKEHPSARLKEGIRSKLALEKVGKIFAGLQNTIRQFQEKWVKTKPTDRATLPQPDFPSLAKQDHLSWQQTGLISALQARSLDIGGSFVDFRERFVDVAYGTAMVLYLPRTSIDFRGNRYLFWKVDETKERIPKLDEAGVRQRAVRAWKMVEARRLAKKEAERLAGEARAAKGSLLEAFRDRPEVQVTLTAPFSWMTYGSLPMLGSQAPPEMSQVTGVDLPGPEFMRTVFDLQPGGVGVAMNQPQTAACVVRMVELAPSDEVLWQQFEADPYGKYAAVSLDDQREVIRAWLEALKSSAGLKWERKPDRRAEPIETTDE